MVYGVYANDDRVEWSPAKIFGDEIKVRPNSNLAITNQRTQIALP
jgi:hypothetical protein